MKYFSLIATYIGFASMLTWVVVMGFAVVQALTVDPDRITPKKGSGPNDILAAYERILHLLSKQTIDEFRLARFDIHKKDEKFFLDFMGSILGERVSSMDQLARKSFNFQKDDLRNLIAVARIKIDDYSQEFSEAEGVPLIRKRFETILKEEV